MNMNALDQNERVITATSLTRDRIIGQQIMDNYRLVKEVHITAKQVQLVFTKIQFQEFKAIESMRVRFKEVAEELNK